MLFVRACHLPYADAAESVVIQREIIPTPSRRLYASAARLMLVALIDSFRWQIPLCIQRNNCIGTAWGQLLLALCNGPSAVRTGSIYLEPIVEARFVESVIARQFAQLISSCIGLKADGAVTLDITFCNFYCRNCANFFL